MQSQLHQNGQHHHHHHMHHHPGAPHLPVSLVTSVSASFNYTSHLSNPHHPNFHSSGSIHHPQPMPFTPAHHIHPMVQSAKLEQNKMSAFDFPMSNNNDYYKQMKNQSPSPTQTIKSSSSNGAQSESMGSPQPSIDCGSALPVRSAYIPNSVEQNSQNGLLEILMSPDKFIQYQVHNSIMFPSLTTDVRLPTWEVLQETTARLLFMAVRWVRCLVPFQTLSKTDQQLLLQVILIDFLNAGLTNLFLFK